MSDTQNSVSTEAIWKALDQVLDPEFGLSIVELGLVYEVEVSEGQVLVRMTLTTPSCPAGGMLLDGVRHVLSSQPGVTGCEVELVWDPAWHPGMLGEAARQKLGW